MRDVKPKPAKLMFAVLTFLISGCTGHLTSFSVQETEIRSAANLSRKTDTAPRTGTREAHLRHTVRWRGETLSHIALWYTGEIRNWKALARINPGTKSGINLGDRILVPAKLLTTRAKMPSTFVHAATVNPANVPPVETVRAGKPLPPPPALEPAMPPQPSLSATQPEPEKDVELMNPVEAREDAETGLFEPVDPIENKEIDLFAPVEPEQDPEDEEIQLFRPD